ncbi:MAG: lectin-like protein [Nannocystaceae bacterium]
MLFRWGTARLVLVGLVSVGGCKIASPDFDGESSYTGTSDSDSDSDSAGTSTASGTSTSGGTTTSTAASDAGSDSASATGTTSGTTGDTGIESDGVSSSGTSTTGCVEVELYPDEDGDMYGDMTVAPILGCPQDGYAEVAGDCDDDNSAINPDAEEVCNGVDDDCDGLLDEYSQLNPDECSTCKVREWGGHLYWICPGPVTWDIARENCTTLGADLTIVGDNDENGFLFQNMLGSNLWIGARDVSPNPVDYTWVDGSALVWNKWTGPNPDQNDGCAQMASVDDGFWRDRLCGETYGFACETLP